MKSLTLFITSLSSGGAEHQLVELSGMLLASGYHVTIVTFADLKDHYDIPKGVHRIRIGTGKNKFQKFISIFLYFVRTDADCIISFGQRESVFCLFPLLFNRKPELIAGDRNLTYMKPSVYENILIHCLFKRASYIVPNSYSQRRYLLSRSPELTNKVVTIINYTDTDKYDSPSYLSHDTVNIGIFARHHPSKNGIRFARAVKIVRDNCSIPFSVKWYGQKLFKDKFPSKSFIDMNNELLSLGLGDIFELYDPVKDVIGIMPEFDVICLPSLHEGFSNSIAEAICCRRPMLVSNVSDNPLMVKDGVNGFLFNPLDVNSIASAIIKFLETTSEERGKMSLNSRMIATSLFEKNRFIADYVRLIES